MPKATQRRYFYFEVYICLCFVAYGGSLVWSALDLGFGATDQSWHLEFLAGLFLVFLGLNGILGGTPGRRITDRLSKLPVFRMIFECCDGKAIDIWRSRPAKKAIQKSRPQRSLASETATAILAIMFLGNWTLSFAAREFKLNELSWTTQLGGVVGIGFVLMLVPSKYD